MNGAAPAPAWRAVLALTAFELRLAARRSENLLVTLVIPAAALVFFSTAAILPVPGPPVDFLLPGAIALGVIATSFVSLGISTAYERGYGVLKRLGGAPLPPGAVIVAKIVAVLVVEIIGAVVLAAIAWLVLGWRPGTDVSPALLAAGLGLGTAAFGGLGLAMAGRLRPEATLALANGLFVAFLLIGGIVLPVDRLPGPIAAVAALLPAAALAEVLRVALAGGSGGPALAVLAAWGVGGVLLAVRWFRWE